MFQLSNQYEQIVGAAYGGMEINQYWSSAQQQSLVNTTKDRLVELVGMQGVAPGEALERIFVFYSPKSDPGRAKWFMDLAKAKASELGVDLDDRNIFTKLPSAASLTIGRPRPKKPSDKSGGFTRFKDRILHELDEAFGKKHPSSN